MNFLEIRDLILSQGEVCDHCLGRQISLAFKGNGPEKVGAALRKAEKESDIEKNLKGKLEIFETKDCFICEGLFLKLDSMITKVQEKMKEQEFNTFLIGSRLPKGMMDREEQLWSKIGAEHCEPIKREINRYIGKKLEEVAGKEADFEHPDLVFIIDFARERVRTQFNPLYIFGRYRKLIRGIPQTRWPCSICKGLGRTALGSTCDNCKGSGKQYENTVEELIAEPVLEELDAKEESFHGEGREDIDARMLGKGRPFVLEIKDPKKRDLNLTELQKKINEFAKGKVEVSDLKFSDKEEIRLIKMRTHDKTYECLITCDDIKEEDLKKLEETFKGLEISQKTPTRVLHRRADKIRKRKVKYTKCELLSDKEFKAQIRTEGGTYIKELVSGDEGRTEPSFLSIIGKPCVVKELDVIEIEEVEALVKK